MAAAFSALSNIEFLLYRQNPEPNAGFFYYIFFRTEEKSSRQDKRARTLSGVLSESGCCVFESGCDVILRDRL